MTRMTRWAGGMVMLLALAGHAAAETARAVPGAETRSYGGPGPERLTLVALAPPPLDVLRGPPRIEGGPRLASGDITETWLAAQPLPEDDAQFACLAKAIYFEARGESVHGQAAVAEVILNRVDSPDFPDTICAVVEQRGKGGCQFSYVCDGHKDRISEKGAWMTAQRVAAVMIGGARRSLTEGATHFHTPAVRPSWSKRYERTARIGYHIFYRRPVRTAMN